MKYDLESSQSFDVWLTKLKDNSVRNKVLARLDRVSNGNFGDYKQLSSRLFELRFTFGAGLRIYYTFKQNQIVLLLAGGDKSSQQRDIEKALSLLNSLEDLSNE